MEAVNKPLPRLFQRSFLIAAWLGWKIESNWTDPFLFFIYSFVKPLAGAGILVVMYSVVSQANFNSPIFAYIYFGNAFYQYVAAVVTGVSWAVIDDREHYRTLKYIYTAPVHIPYYLLGRGVARIITGSFSVVLTILTGIFFLQVPFDLARVDWLLFGLTLVIGIVMLAMIGLLLAGITLLVAQHSYSIGDTVAGAMFLFSGAIFPLEVLPAWLQPLGYILPITYWLELIRRALIGHVADAFPTFTNQSNAHLMVILVGLTVFFAVASTLIFRTCEHQARERGLIDYSSNY